MRLLWDLYDMTRLVSVMLAVEEQNPQPFTGHRMGRLGQHIFAPGWFDCLLELKSRSKDTGLVDTLTMPISMHSGAHKAQRLWSPPQGPELFCHSKGH